MANERQYTSRRAGITTALAKKIGEIDGRGLYHQSIAETSPRLKFWDEVEEFPAVHLNAGSETRQYQASGYKDRFLVITIRCYVNEEDAQFHLNALMEDVETVIEENSNLQYLDKQNNEFNCQQITVISITTDEGVLEPFGVGELEVEVRY